MRKERVARKERLALQVGIALTAGVFGAVPAAEGAPVVDKIVTEGTQVAQSGSITDVTGTQQNNIVKWTDFSVNQGETVRFDKGAQEKNYLNLVTGPKTSEIAGRIEGGKDVYLVNPHGVIFSHGAQVNVGNLYVSTENTDAALEAFNAGKTAGAVLTAGTANADVVNLGGVEASSVIVNGDNIRFLTDDVQAPQATQVTQVTLQATKNIITEQDVEGGKEEPASGYSFSFGSTGQYENKQAIFTPLGLAAMNKNLNGHYSLEADLTLSGNYTPIGGNGYGAFTGTFDGNFHTLSGIEVSGGTYGGLFGLTSGATIQNVGVKSGTINAQYVGGIVGRAENQTKLIDVFNDGTTIQPTGKGVNSFYAGGIVGYAQNSSINKAYNTGAIGGRGGGILGCSDSTTVSNVYNTYTGNNSAAGIVGYGVQNDTVSSITNAYTTGSKIGSNLYTGKQSNAYSVTGVDTASKTSATYSGFDISSSGSDDTVWRIYEGKSLPLLRDFLRRGKGAVTVNYDYTQKSDSSNGGTNTGSVSGNDLTLTYNNGDVKLSNITYTNANGLTIDTSKIVQDTGSLRNANVYNENGKSSNGQMAFYCTAQDGYDLVGGNVYINQREVNISGDSLAGKHVTKVYDGKKDATEAVKALFNAADTSATGLLAGDTTATLDTHALQASFSDKNVGVGKTVTADGTLSLTQKAHNYKVTGSGTAQLNNVTLSGDITPASLTLSLADGKTLTKEYEGKANAATKETVSSLISSDKTVQGLMTDDNGKQDTVTLGFQDANAKGTYGAKASDGTFTADGSAGAHDVQLAGIQLTGEDAENYNLVDADGNIIWGKQYTAGTDAKASGTLTDVGKASGGTAYLSGTITKKNLTADGFSWYDGSTLHDVKNNTKEYDNTSDYTDANGKRVNKVDGSSGLVAGDSVAFTVQDSGTHFVHDDVADGKVTVSNDDAKTVKAANGIAYAVTVSGEDAKNYTLNGQDIQDGGTATVYGEGHITPRTLNIVAGKGVDKVYDGTSDVVQAANSSDPLAEGWVIYEDNDAAHQLIAGDGSKISLTGSHYAGSDVIYDADGNVAAQNITYKVSVLQGGEDKGNYVFSSSGKTTAELSTDASGYVVQGKITPAPITALTFQDVSKTYDASEDVRGKQENDKIAITGGTWLKGNDKTEIALSADDVKSLLKTDDIAGQYGHKKADGTFESDKHARNSEQKDVRYTGIKLQNEKGNYILSLAGSDEHGAVDYGKGVIRPLTINNKDAISLEQTQSITKVYNLSTAVGDDTHKNTDYVGKLTTKVSDDADADTIELGYSVHAADYADWNQGENKKVTYQLDITPDENGDYTLADSLKTDGYFVYDKLIGTITPRHLTAKVINENTKKVYDGTTAVVKTDAGGTTIKAAPDELASFAATSGGAGIIKGDTVTNATTAAYKDENVGTPGIAYTFALDNNEAGNYVLDTTSADGEGTITPREVTVSFDSVDKPYDGTKNVIGDKYTLGNVVAKDTNALTLSYDKSYENPNVNSTTNPNWVNYTKLTIGGDAARNYKLADDIAQKNIMTGEGKIHSAKVTKDNVKVTFGDITKVYDGSRSVSYQHDAKEYPDQQGKADQLDYIKGFTINGISLGYGADKDYTLADDALYNSKDAADAASATYHFQLSPTMLTNFDFSGINDANFFDAGNGILTETPKATITPKTVTAALSGVADVIEKTYDGKTEPLVDVTNRVTFTGLLGGDAQLGKVTGAYDTKDVVYNKDGTVGTKNIIYTPTLAVTGASNYQLKLVSAGAEIAGTTLTGAGQGRILPKELTFAADYTEKTYDATPDAEVKNPVFSGFADGESLTPGNSADGKSLVKAQYGIYDGTTFTPDENVEGNEESKAVAYTNLQEALANASGQSDTIKASNYTIANTVYFAKAKGTEKGQGRILRLALSAGDIKMRWSDNITKQYDGTDAVDLSDPKKNFQIYIDEVTGTDGKKTQLPNTVYLQYELGPGGAKYNSKNVGADTVTYDIRGLKNSDKLANNFKFNSGDARDLSNYQGTFTLKNGDLSSDGMKAAVVGITKRVLNAEVSKKNNTKVYDGSSTAAVSTADGCPFLVLTKGTDNKEAAQIKEMLERDLGGDYSSLVTANYLNEDKTAEDASASVSKSEYNESKQGAKNVRYTLSLTDNLKGNYTFDADATSKSYDGYGEIFKRVTYVDFADDQQDTKVYDGTADVKNGDAAGTVRTFQLSMDKGDGTGIIQADQNAVHLKNGTVQGKYKSPHVSRGEDGNPVSQTVEYTGFAVDNSNYEVKAKAADGSDIGTLAGMGIITPAKATVSLENKNITKVYNGTKAAVTYLGADGSLHDLLTENVQVELPANLVSKDSFLLNRGQGTQGVYQSKDVADNGNNPVTYTFTLQNYTKDKSDLHADYDVELKSGETGTADGAGGTLTTMGTITPRTLTVKANDAAKEYDGTADVRDAGRNLVFGNLVGKDNIQAFAKGRYQETSAGAGDAADATDGSEKLLDHDVIYTDIDLQNSNYKLADDVTSVTGKGTISRATIALTAEPVTLTAGEALPLAYGGGAVGWKTEADAAAWAADADAANYSYAPQPGQLSSAGTYPIWAWYRTGTDAAGLPLLTRVERKAYGRNYYLAQAPSNQTALHILRPSNPEIPDHLDDMLNPARKFVPNRESYNHASHDVGNDALRSPQAGIEYAKSGINVGAGAASGKDRASMAVSGEGSVVNLTGGDAVHGAVRNLTDSSAAGFIVSGNPETFGVAPGTLTQLAQQTEGGTPSGGAAVAGGADARGSVLTGQDAHQTARVPSAEPAAAAAGVADGVQLFHEDGARDAQQPVRLAATGDVQLFGDGIPATQAAGTPAEVSLFDDEEAASARPASLTPEAAAVSLFDDEESTAAAQKPSTAGTVQVTTASSDDEEEKKEKEEEARAAALKAKGADIGIESEDAGVNLAG